MATVRHIGLFPFCVGEGDPSQQDFPYLYSIGLTTQRVIEWFWRIKSWRLDIDVLISETERFVRSDIVPVTYLAGNVEPMEVTSERDLICFTSDTAFSVEKCYPELVVQGGNCFGFGLFVSGGGFFPNLLRQDDLFYPAIAVNFFEPSNLSATYDTNTGTISAQVDPALGTMSITPHEWWAYDPGDGGGPIYDTATGRQLRAFAN